MEETNKYVAKAHKSKKLSMYWIIPIIALIVTAILIWNNTLNKGPVIELTITSADGIVEGTTQVKVRSVTVGRVIDVSLSDDYRKAILKVEMEADTEDLLCEDTIFWVVKPRVENTGISGLDTLLSGAYIELRRGQSNKSATTFDVLDRPPARTDDYKVVSFDLLSSASAKLNEGDIITYRGINVGAVIDADFDFSINKLRYKVFVREPYSNLLNSSSRFWISSGIDLSFGAEGFKLRTESLDNIIRGGIAFDNINEDLFETVPLDINNDQILYDDYDSAYISTFDHAMRYVVMVKDSVKGLKIASPVIFKGINIGNVIDVNYYENGIRDIVSEKEYIPIVIGLNIKDKDIAYVKDIFNKKLQTNSLCASVDNANIITGDALINLFYDDNKCVSDKKSYRNLTIIPTIPNKSIQGQISELLERFKAFDIKGLSDEAVRSLKAMTEAMEAFTKSNDDIKQRELIEVLTKTFKDFDVAVLAYGPGSKINNNIESLSMQLKELLKDLSPAAVNVGQEPSSIIFGVDNKDIEPQRKQHEK